MYTVFVQLYKIVLRLTITEYNVQYFYWLKQLNKVNLFFFLI